MTDIQINKELAQSQHKKDNGPSIVRKGANCMTSNMLTPYEVAYITGMRARMIDDSGIYYCDISELSDIQRQSLKSEHLAQLELLQKQSPLCIQRKLNPWSPDIEVLDVNTLTLPVRINLFNQ